MEFLATATKLPVVTIALDYARLSKDKKKLSENVNIQHRENRSFIEDQCWEYGGSYDDNDISASEFGTKTRDDYWRMVEVIKNWPNREDVIIKLVIVVTEMPRLYRQMQELLDLIKMAESSKLSGIWTTDGEGYDLSTPEGVHRAIGAVNNAMLESKRASKRQRRKKKAQAEQGKYMGGARRYGFEGPIKDEHGNIINRDRINVGEIKEEIANWEDWYNRLIASEGQASIIKDNNRRGIVTPEGKEKWQVGNFKRLMINEAYVVFDATGHPEDCPCLQNRPDGGTLVHETSGTKHRGKWRGLITRQQYELLLACFKETAQNWNHGMVRGRKYLLSAIAVCGGTHEGKRCGTPMYGNGRTLASGRYQRRYRCRGCNNYLEKVGCGKVFRDAEALDAYVIEQVLYRIDTAEVVRALVPQEDSDRAEELTHKLTAQRKRRDLIKRQYARGEIETLEEYKFMRGAADQAIDELQAELGKLQTTKAANLLPGDGKIREAWDRRWEAGDLEWCRSILKLVVKEVIVSPGHPGSFMWNGHRFNPDDVEIIWLN